MKSKRKTRKTVALGVTLAAIAAGCKKSEATATQMMSAAPPPAASSTPTAAPGNPSPAPSQGAAATSMSSADRQRYEATFVKCQQLDVASCEAVCEEFDPQACAYLTSLMLAQKVPDDPSKRAKVNEKGCSKGALRSCNQLGTAYKKGDGVPVDVKKAIELYQKSCDGGEGGGCTHLASVYGYGDLVPQDIDKAKRYSDRACELGDKNCKPPLANGSWPRDAKLEDIVVDVKKWDGEVVQLRSVAAYRGSPTSGYLFEPGGNPMTDGVSTMVAEGALEDTKKAWVRMPSSRTGVPVKKVTVRVEATTVPGRARFWILDSLEFVGTQP